MTEPKERLDILLVERGLFPSREKAKAHIMAGSIYVDDIKIDKCGEKVKISSEIYFKGEEMPYVSRGGYKLEKAIKSFNLNLDGKTCLDIGASTGGFTDCMLQNGARKVYAIDVGYGQFAWKLRTDPRVVCMERTNIRYVSIDDLKEQADFSSIDVSFISLSKVIPAIIPLIKDNGEIVALIKPQFEAGRDKVGKKGVVREASTHREVIYGICSMAQKLNLKIINLDFSPIKGPEGNIEYLIYLSKDIAIQTDFTESKVDEVVNNSHKDLIDG